MLEDLIGRFTKERLEGKGLKELVSFPEVLKDFAASLKLAFDAYPNWKVGKRGLPAPIHVNRAKTEFLALIKKFLPVIEDYQNKLDNCFFDEYYHPDNLEKLIRRAKDFLTDADIKRLRSNNIDNDRAFDAVLDKLYENLDIFELIIFDCREFLKNYSPSFLEQNDRSAKENIRPKAKVAQHSTQSTQSSRPTERQALASISVPAQSAGATKAPHIKPLQAQKKPLTSRREEVSNSDQYDSLNVGSHAHRRPGAVDAVNTANAVNAVNAVNGDLDYLNIAYNFGDDFYFLERAQAPSTPVDGLREKSFSGRLQDLNEDFSIFDDYYWESSMANSAESAAKDVASARGEREANARQREQDAVRIQQLRDSKEKREADRRRALEKENEKNLLHEKMLADLEATRKALTQARSRNGELESDLARQKQTLEDKIRVLEAAVAEAVAKHTQKHREVELKQKEVDQHLQKFNDTKLHVERLTKEVQQEKQGATAVQQQLRTKTEEAAKHFASVERLTKAVTAEKDGAAVIQQQLKTKTEEAAELLAKLKQAADEALHLNETIQKLQAELQAQRAELQASADEKANLWELLDSLHAENEELTAAQVEVADAAEPVLEKLRKLYTPGFDGAKKPKDEGKKAGNGVDPDPAAVAAAKAGAQVNGVANNAANNGKP